MADLTGYIATGLVSLVVGVLSRYFEPKARVVYWIPGGVFFDLKQQNVRLQTHTISVQNLGRLPAENIEIVHKTRPDFFQLAPPVPFEELNATSGEHVIRIKSLGRKEYFTIQLLSYINPPVLLYVRSKEGTATPIQIRFQRYMPRWAIALIWSFVVIGFGFFLYWLIKAIIWISAGIGVV